MNTATTIEFDDAKGTFLTPADEADLPAALASQEKMDALVARVTAQARAHVPDLSTETSRKAIASNAYKVARSKTAILDAGKAQTLSLREAIKAMNERRDTAIDALQAVQVEVRKPLTDWEKIEEARQAALQARLDDLEIPPLIGMTAEQLRAEMKRLAGIKIDDTWQEVEAAAATKRRDNLATVDAAFRHAEQIEAERAELDEFRRQNAEREAATAKAAEERAAAERAEKGRLEREAEVKRLAEELRAAEERAAAAALEKAEREAQAKVEAAEREKREALEAARLAEERAQLAAERAERDRKAAAEKAAAEREAAIEAERLRVAEERRQQEVERQRRAADVARRSAAKATMVTVLLSLLDGLEADEERAEVIADALMEAKVPGVELAL